MRAVDFVRAIVASILVLSAAPTLSQTVAEVREELLQMMRLDQQGRSEISQIREQFGNNSPEVASAWEKQGAIDSRNMTRLEEIFETYGWPTLSSFGQEAATAAFLILQHSDLEHQRMYLADFQKAVEAGEARGSSYALLYDRVLMGEGKRQLYGSQLRLNESTGGYYLWPIEDGANVDKRRAALGMPPLSEYLRQAPFEIEEVPEGVVESFASEGD